MVYTAAFVAALACFAVVTVMAVRAIRDDGFIPAAAVWLGLTALIAAGFFALSLVITVTANMTLAHHDRYRSVPLLALRDGEGRSGDYVLGTGSSGDNEQFVFYWRDGDAERLEHVDASQIRLFEDSPKPYAVQYTGCVLSNPSLAGCLDAGTSFSEIHVPPGTVQSKFDLSLNH